MEAGQDQEKPMSVEKFCNIWQFVFSSKKKKKSKPRPEFYSVYFSWLPTEACKA